LIVEANHIPHHLRAFGSNLEPVVVTCSNGIIVNVINNKLVGRTGSERKQSEK
jgi:hypothetical protein